MFRTYKRLSICTSNNGNELSIAFAKGFGWRVELNTRYIFEKLFESEKGLGDPPENRESQNANAVILNNMKKVTGKPLIESLKSIEQLLLKDTIKSDCFQKCYFENGQNSELTAFIKKLLI